MRELSISLNSSAMRASAIPFWFEAFTWCALFVLMRSAVGFLAWPLGDFAHAVAYILMAVQQVDSSLSTLGTVGVVTGLWPTCDKFWIVAPRSWLFWCLPILWRLLKGWPFSTVFYVLKCSAMKKINSYFTVWKSEKLRFSRLLGFLKWCIYLACAFFSHSLGDDRTPCYFFSTSICLEILIFLIYI